MRLLLALAFAGCTIGAPPPEVPARPPPDPDRMPSEVLAHQDPAADTSHNRELSRSSLSQPNPFLEVLRLVFPPLWCNASGSGDAGGVLVVGAMVLALRRRNHSSRIRNAPETRDVSG
jgi:uncharacterized protein (TIGR03382 family)